jgi:hypothetical protein
MRAAQTSVEETILHIPSANHEIEIVTHDWRSGECGHDLLLSENFGRLKFLG